MLLMNFGRKSFYYNLLLRTYTSQLKSNSFIESNIVYALTVQYNIFYEK